ncbi:hypothetical protein [Streptomyces sp. NPDC048734]|uniref:hypothetical protein n=1 Tax=Streptomyces sp. NPDC048734 TaxID=3365590 RepID=UPI0037243D14
MGVIACDEDGARAANCTGDFSIDPPYRLDSNGDATTWKVAFNAMVWTADDHLESREHLTGLGGTQVKRAAKATANASPEPVVKGKAPTVTGRLTRGPGQARLRRLRRQGGEAPVPRGGHQHLLDRQDRQRRLGGPPAHHGRRERRRLLAPDLRRGGHDRRRLGGRRPRRRQVAAAEAGGAEEPYRPGGTPTNLRKCRVR